MVKNQIQVALAVTEQVKPKRNPKLDLEKTGDTNYQSSILSVNVRGLYCMKEKTKVKQLEFLAIQYNAIAILITESWLTDDILNAEISVKGYTLYRMNRVNRKRGVCVCTLEVIMQQSLSPQIRMDL